MPADHQTEKSKYPSAYSPEAWVTGAQYICELICEKKAAVEGTTLPIRFWRLPEWEKFFKSQVRLVNQMTKKYSVRAVIATLKESGKWWSLRTPIMQGNIQRHHKRIRAEDKFNAEKIRQQKTVNRSTIESKPRQRVTRKTNLSVLYDIDEGNNGEKEEG